MPETKCGFDNVPGGASGADLLAGMGPTLLVNIGFDSNWKLGVGIPPTPGITDVNALVDTGAAECCIDNLLAVQLNLPIVDRRPYGGIGGEHMANMYLAQVHVPSLSFTMYGTFAGVHLSEGGQVHKALIGRTFLRRFKMTYDGTNGVVVIASG